MKLIETVQCFIEDNNLFNKNDKIILGLSGGLDSVVLLDVVFKLGYKITIAHCNFHLRKTESLRDEKFAEDLAIFYGLNYVKTDFDTMQYAASQKLSIEMAARELRYAWFEEMRVKTNSKYIVIAHHIDDSVETILLNLTRGTGLKGVLGISPKIGHIVRPFLCVSREEIEQYASENNIKYVVDSTNLESIYKRNSMRLDVLPLLKNMNPSVNKSIDSFSYKMREVDKIYTYYINQHISEVFQNNSINIERLNETVSPKSILYEILNQYGFTPTTIEDLYNVLNGESGKLFYSDRYVALKDRDFIYIKSIENNNEENIFYKIEYLETITTPIHLQQNVKDISDCNDLDASKNICYLDENKLKYPLILRKWKKGDRFTPLGMKGSKKLSDYFSNKKYSLFDKSNAWVIVSDDKIVWIVGERSDNEFKITDKTSKVVIIEYKDN